MAPMEAMPLFIRERLPPSAKSDIRPRGRGTEIYLLKVEPHFSKTTGSLWPRPESGQSHYPRECGTWTSAALPKIAWSPGIPRKLLLADLLREVFTTRSAHGIYRDVWTGCGKREEKWKEPVVPSLQISGWHVTVSCALKQKSDGKT